MTRWQAGGRGWQGCHRGAVGGLWGLNDKVACRGVWVGISQAPVHHQWRLELWLVSTHTEHGTHGMVQQHGCRHLSCCLMKYGQMCVALCVLCIM